MFPPAPPASPAALPETWFAVLAADRPAGRQERVFVGLVQRTVASALALGRRPIAQLLGALGVGALDWTAWYRLFNRGRGDVAALPADGPVVAAVAAIQLPRPSRTRPGCGYTVQARIPTWRRGIHRAQRFVGLRLLLPRADAGDRRAAPLRWRPLRTATTTAVGNEPERTEGPGAGALLAWLRAGLAGLGRGDHPRVALGDGASSTAPVLGALPDRVARCARGAKNRALDALPTDRPTGRGRQPR